MLIIIKLLPKITPWVEEDREGAVPITVDVGVNLRRQFHQLNKVICTFDRQRQLILIFFHFLNLGNQCVDAGSGDILCAVEQNTEVLTLTDALKKVCGFVIHL